MPRQRLKLYEPAKYPMKPVCAIFCFFGQKYSHIYIYNIHVHVFFLLYDSMIVLTSVIGGSWFFRLHLGTWFFRHFCVDQ